MESVTHRQMRNQSGDILRRVAAGESFRVTNNGVVAALIVPPGDDTRAALAARGQLRPARAPTSTLRSIARRPSPLPSAAIVADARGRW